MGKLAKIADKKAAKENAYDRNMKRFAELLVLTYQADDDINQLPALQNFLAQNPDLCENVHQLANGVKSGLLRAIASGAGTRLFVEKEVEELQARLTSLDASPVEQLLIDAVLLCWLRVQYAESFRTHYMTGSHPFREIEFAEKMLTHSHRRFANALKALARVQKLAMPKTASSQEESLKAMRLL